MGVEQLTTLIRTDLEEMTGLSGRIIEGGQAGPLPKLPFITYFWASPRHTRRGYRIMTGWRATPSRPSLWPTDERNKGWGHDALVEYDDAIVATLDIDVYAPRENPRQARELASSLQRYFEIADFSYDIDPEKHTWGKAVVRRVTPLINRAIPDVATPYSRLGFTVVFHVFEALDALERTVESIGLEADVAVLRHGGSGSYLDRISQTMHVYPEEYERYTYTVKSRKP